MKSNLNNNYVFPIDLALQSEKCTHDPNLVSFVKIQKARSQTLHVQICRYNPSKLSLFHKYFSQDSEVALLELLNEIGHFIIGSEASLLKLLFEVGNFTRIALSSLNTLFLGQNLFRIKRLIYWQHIFGSIFIIVWYR